MGLVGGTIYTHCGTKHSVTSVLMLYASCFFCPWRCMHPWAIALYLERSRSNLAWVYVWSWYPYACMTGSRSLFNLELSDVCCAPPRARMPLLCMLYSWLFIECMAFFYVIFFRFPLLKRVRCTWNAHWKVLDCITSSYWYLFTIRFLSILFPMNMWGVWFNLTTVDSMYRFIPTNGLESADYLRSFGHSFSFLARSSKISIGAMCRSHSRFSVFWTCTSVSTSALRLHSWCITS